MQGRIGQRDTRARASGNDGVWRLPDGAAYVSRVGLSTTTSLTPEQIHQIGLQEMARIQAEMRELMRQLGFEGSLQDFFAHSRGKGRPSRRSRYDRLLLPVFELDRFTPFAPFGYGAHDVDGTKVGVMGAAAIIFFAFYGFDSISTVAEEVKQPSRDLTIGIVGSMLICTLIDMGVAAAALGAVPFQHFSASPEPLAFILKELNQPRTAALIASAAVLAMPTVIRAFLLAKVASSLRWHATDSCLAA